MGTRKTGPGCAGNRKRRCECCGRSRFYCCKTIDARALRNSHDADSLVEVKAGAVVCDRCVKYNAIDTLVQELPVSKRTKRCNRCGGAGKIRNPTYELLPTNIKRGQPWWKCPMCAGAGEVAA